MTDLVDGGGGSLWGWVLVARYHHLLMPVLCDRLQPLLSTQGSSVHQFPGGGKGPGCWGPHLETLLTQAPCRSSMVVLLVCSCPCEV